MPRRRQRSTDFSMKRFRKHENGVYAFSDYASTFSPRPIPAQARAAYAEEVERLRDSPFFAGWTYRLIVAGEIEAEEILGGPAEGTQIRDQGDGPRQARPGF